MIVSCKETKGISPLIAAVILIAFVIAVAAIASTFFMDIAEDWGGEIENEDPVGTIFTDIEIISTDKENDTLAVRNSGRSDIDGFVVTVHGDVVESLELENSSLTSGHARTLNLTGTELEGSMAEADEVEVAPVDSPKRSEKSEL
ncbi:MAG: archaellin/type IV pilin N-terminal domain-containing protein [Candidatus Aenigmatarchaeota archaeon]